jgi:hypothetical protein
MKTASTEEQYDKDREDRSLQSRSALATSCRNVAAAGLPACDFDLCVAQLSNGHLR